MKAQIVLENVGVHLPNRLLFSQVNWTLFEGMRVALTGRNGSGKSTLLKIMAGQLDPTDGYCTLVGKNQLQIGYLDQSLLDSTVLEIHERGQNTLSPLKYIHTRLVEENPHMIEEEIDWQVVKMLHGLGFSDSQIERPLANLSGGWLLRVFIALTLIKKPDVLLLDEPTNHLDLSSIQWLEEFLQRDFQGSLVLVTHDTALQTRVTESLAAVHGGNFYFRKSQNGYLSFLESLQEEERILARTIDGLEKKCQELQNFISRFKAKARMASRAQSKQKALEKLQEEVAQEKEKLQRTKGFSYNMKFRFRFEKEGAKFPVSCEQVHFKYQDSDPEILKKVSFDVKKGQKIAIIGDNGAGKTTLLNIIAGRLTPTEGAVTFGSHVDLGYFGQHQLDELSLENSVLENLLNKSEGLGLEQVRGWLGAFGFQSDDDCNKPAKVLSGGERARLAMLRILCAPCNVCLLDEPTNHLDIETKEILVEAIQNFEGSAIFVSHDRTFIEQIADRIIHLSNDHEFTDHIGNLKSFFEKYPEKLRQSDADVSPTAPLTPVKEAAKKPTLSYEERKKRKNRRRSLEKKIAECEKEIESFGHKKAELEERTKAAGFYEQNLPEKNEVLSQIADLEKKMTATMSFWEKCSLELEQIKED